MSFHSINSEFRRAEVLNFDDVQFVNLPVEHSFGVIAKKSLLKPRFRSPFEIGLV
jgi:hypothetical protein